MNLQALGPMVTLPEGVTLRDWFAGHVLQARAASDGAMDARNHAVIAEVCYELANAMLAEKARWEHEECAHAAPAEAPPF